MSSLALWVGVVLIGGLASIARFVVHGLFPRDSEAGFPLGTLAVNLSGSFVLGLLVGAGVHRRRLPARRHRRGRLLHDVLDLDARQRAARRATDGPRGPR